MYFSKAGHSNYSSSYVTCCFLPSELYQCLWFSSANSPASLSYYDQTLIHPHCYCFLESKEGTVRWTTPDPFFHARDTQLHKDSFALHCAIGVRQDSCRSTFTGVQSSCSWLSGAQGGDQAFGRHGGRV